MSDETPAPEEAETPTADETPADAPDDAARAARKARKKKAKAEAAAADVAADPRAVEIAAAFDAGNFARVRQLATTLAASDDAGLAAVGRDYLARIAVDPIQIAFLGLCAIALLTIAWIYIPH